MAYGFDFHLEQVRNHCGPVNEQICAEAQKNYEARHFFDGVNLSNKVLAEKKEEEKLEKQLAIYLAERAAERRVLRAEARIELVKEIVSGVICGAAGSFVALLFAAVVAMI